MHSNKALTIPFQFKELALKCLKGVIEKPESQAEWTNILNLMVHMRQSLACAKCGKLMSELCQKSHGEGYEFDDNLKYTLVCVEKLSKYIVQKEVFNQWSHLQISTQSGPLTLGQLIQEFIAKNDPENESTANLDDKFARKIKEKEHHCRCGGKASGNLTCLGQRCACYRKGKGCTKCKCNGCKNPNGTPSSTYG